MVLPVCFNSSGVFFRLSLLSESVIHFSMVPVIHFSTRDSTFAKIHADLFRQQLI